MSSQTLAPYDPRQLLQWRPVHLLLALLALVLGAALWRTIENQRHFVADSVQIDTEGTQGVIDKDELVLDLPVQIYNGTDAAIVMVNLWTDAFACPTLKAPQSACTRLHSSEQTVNMRVSAGSSGSENQQIRTGLPDHLAGDFVRVHRRVTGVTSDVDVAQSRLKDKWFAEHDPN